MQCRLVHCGELLTIKRNVPDGREKAQPAWWFGSLNQKR